jgi:hypothetical protein
VCEEAFLVVIGNDSVDDEALFRKLLDKFVGEAF